MKKNQKWGFYLFLMPVALWLLLLIILPHIDLFIMSFRFENDYGDMTWNLANYNEFFSEPIYWLTFIRTAVYSIIVTFLTLVVGLPVAFYITKVAAVKYKGPLTLPVLLPFWVSELVRVYGWMIHL